MESWMRKIIWNEGNVLVNPKGWNVIVQDDFSWFLFCSSQFNCFQLKRVIRKWKFPLEVNDPIYEWIHYGIVFIRHADSDMLWHILVH